jgi:hypothetical protein
MYANCSKFAHVPIHFIFSPDDPIHVYNDYFQTILQGVGCKVTRYETENYKAAMKDAKEYIGKHVVFTCSNL